MKAPNALYALLVTLFVTGSALASDDPLAQARERLEDARSSAVISPEDVAAISTALSHALQSDHRGLESAALRLVIAYEGVVELKRGAVIDMVRLYRDHTDERIRHMAVVAIAASGDSWGLDFLARSLAFEESKTVLHTIRASLAETRTPAVADDVEADRPLWARGTPVKA